MAVAVNAMAWNVVGHRIVADVAYRNLTPAARYAVDDILGWERAMIATSSWPDEIKSDTIYKGQDEWHYQDLDAGKTESDLRTLYDNKTLEGYHLFQAKDSIIKLLKQEPRNADALKFLVHLAGDQYQPMHMGHHDDLGGNTARFYWFGHSTNLHALWDTYMIDYTHFSSTEFAQFLCERFAAERDQLYYRDEFDCILDTYALVEAIYKEYDALCQGVTPDERGYRRFTRGFEYNYSYKFRDVFHRQLFMAGIQLARILNEIYK